MIAKIVSQLLAPYVLVILLLAAVVWQTHHIIDWAMTLSAMSGDGSVLSYLRWHAYVYVDWFFGTTPSGWVIGS